MSTEGTKEAAPRATENRSTTPASNAFSEHISSGWAERVETIPAAPRAGAQAAATRRDRLSVQFAGTTLVIPAGPRKQRANDTDYPFRAHSAFSYLTGWGSDAEPDAVLVLQATESGHRAELYFRAAAGRDSSEFYANSDIGEFWIGPRPSLAHVAADLGVETFDLAALESALHSSTTRAVIAEADPAVTSLIEADPGTVSDASVQLMRAIGELRLVKDDYELEQMQLAVDATAAGFVDVLRDLDNAAGHTRGERIVEGTFHRRARIDGNTVGYDTIAASGPHACILHWTQNDGPVLDGDLILLDAGIEVDSLYTADITRTLPVSGTFTEIQRRVYEAVLEAADAAFSIVRPGIVFRDVHAKAMEVIAAKTAEWGILPVSAEESLKPENQFHRRWMVHGTSHHLGLDVHDCAAARREMYMDGVVEEGMVFTIEPGLYFQPDDLTVPVEYRGIGVRIEDDIVVTAEGAVNLSRGIPRTVADVEAWIAQHRQG
ncbi:aminopeptidase P family protein [Humidisolicoccus flavus]|uniref:aminopeptidase P family protein n=1 Tax=Humidisolicoccus flavus TaxID=3111414 RepID=UPI003255A363